MSECGKCRHYAKLCDDWRTKSGDSYALGICEREDWENTSFNWTSWGPQGLRVTHHKHLLSSTHPAPPCFEGKRKVVKREAVYKDDTSDRDRANGMRCTRVGTRLTALDDIKKGEEVEIV